MGIFYTFGLCVGFKVEEDEIKKVFRKEDLIPGEFHMKKRFDPKTGEELSPAKVWDKKPVRLSWYEVDGKRFEPVKFFDHLGEILSKKFECTVTYWFNAYDTSYVVFSTLLTDSENRIDEGKITVSTDSVSIDKIVKAEKSLNDLRLRLEEAGLKVGEPKVFIASSAG